jgi:hypothetical protein
MRLVNLANYKMNYQKIYNNLMHRDVARVGYVEKHHILRMVRDTDTLVITDPVN